MTGVQRWIRRCLTAPLIMVLGAAGAILLSGDNAGRHGPIRAMALEPDGRAALVVPEHERSVYQWDLSDPTRQRDLPNLVDHVVDAVTYSADSRLVVTASEDGTARVWDVVARSRPTSVAALTGQVGPVRAASFGADGRSVLTAGSDRTAIAWDISALAGVVSDPRRVACEVAGRGLGRDEWREAVPRILGSRHGPQTVADPWSADHSEELR
jgi:WD40 repeat protein